MYDRNLGQLGQWHPSLDWAVADYRFTIGLGFGRGKLKRHSACTTIRRIWTLHHVFALLPQGCLSHRLRDTTIAHAGADIYGTFLSDITWETLLYTVYAGIAATVFTAAIRIMVAVSGALLFRELGGLQYGADFRWNPPLQAVTLGASRVNQDMSATGSLSRLPESGRRHGAVSNHPRKDWTNQFYGRYRDPSIRVQCRISPLL